MTTNRKDPQDDRRQHQRHQIKSATFNTGDRSGEIIDISMGGLAFSYIERAEWEAEPVDRGMLLGERDLAIADIPLKVISDCAINSGISMVRRCSVKFVQLTQKQLDQLEYFIWANTTGSTEDYDEND